jgi:hypothetical protein
MRPPLAARRPRRLTITVPEFLFHWIFERADQEGRSASNLAAHLLERAFSSAAEPPSP